jgi:hypothetical protein
VVRWSILIGFVALIFVLGTSSILRSEDSTANSVVVNGKPILSKVIDGEMYVRPEDFARALGATLTYKGSAVIINTGLPSLEVKSTGTIKGTLTYFFNRNYGNKPDSGSEIWLVREDVLINDRDFHMAFEKEYEVGIDSGKRFQILKHTLTDGNGSFELAGILEGQYTVIIKSSHVRAVNSRDQLGKTVTIRVSVRSGEVSDVSTDFGMTGF